MEVRWWHRQEAYTAGMWDQLHLEFRYNSIVIDIDYNVDLSVCMATMFFKCIFPHIYPCSYHGLHFGSIAKHYQLESHLGYRRLWLSRFSSVSVRHISNITMTCISNDMLCTYCK